MKILIIAAHPDDEVLGCGGTIAHLRRDDHEVSVSILGEGITSRYQDRSMADKSAVQELRSQARGAADILGVTEISFHDLPDNRFDSAHLLDVVKIIEKEIERFRPDVVYTHNEGDLNVDHAVTYRATVTATRPFPGQSVRVVYAFETPSSTEWSFGSSVFRPNVFVDITQTLDLKMRALSCYKSEIRDFPHPRSLEGVRIAAERWGTVSGYRAAETFTLVRLLRGDDSVFSY